VQSSFYAGMQASFTLSRRQTGRESPGPWRVMGLVIFSAVLLLVGRANGMELSPNKVVLTAGDIKRLNVQTIQDLLNLVPGVQADSSTVTIRGSSDVRVLLDGLSLKNALTPSVTIRWNLVSLPSVAKVVILKGSGSVSYGDDSSGGVIIISTKRLGGEQGYAQASFGGNGIQDHQLQFSRAAGVWGLRADAGYYHSDGFRLNNDKTIWRFGLKSSLAPASWQEEKARGRADDVSLAMNFSQTERGLPGLPAFPHPQARERQRDLGANLACKWLGVASGTYFTNFRKDFSNPETNMYTNLESLILRQEFKGSAVLGFLGPVTWGASLQDSRARGNELDAVEEQSYGIFASKKMALESIPLTLNLGLRENIYSNFESVLNPEADLTLILGMLSLHGGVTMSNNVPSFLQRYDRSSTTEPNPDLSLEKSTNFTFGASFQPSQKWRAEMSLFHDTVKDRITFVRGDGGIGRYENVGEALLAGLDLAITCRPWPWLHSQLAYGYLDAKDQSTGLWLPGKSRHSASLDIQVIPSANVQLGVKLSYNSQAFTKADNTETAPSYYTVDLRAEYSVMSFRIFGKVDNLLDEEYLTGDGYPASPRVWQLGVSRDF
jgi:vitamin B12 transporter